MLEDWRGFQHGGSIPGSVILCGKFRRISQLWDNAHTLNLKNCLLYLSSTVSQFFDFIRCIVFDFIFYCVTVHTLYYRLCEKWTDQHNTSAEQSESPTGIEPMTCRTPGGRSIYWAMRTHAEQRHFTELMCDRCPAYCWDQYCRSHRECSKWIKMLNVIGNS